MNCIGGDHPAEGLHADVPLCQARRAMAVGPRGGARVVALVGCGKAKRPTAAPARDLYSGPLFKGCLKEGLARAGEQSTVILSAKVRPGLGGMLPLDHAIEPYDVYLPRLPRAGREEWGRATAAALVARFGVRVEAHILAGAPYVNALRPFLPPTWVVVEPMKGLTQGQRLAWLKGRR